MKHLLITLALLYINTLFGQELIGKDWKIDSFLALYPEVTDVYFLTDSEMKKCQVGRDSIPINLDIDSGTYYLHKISKNEIHLIKSKGKRSADKQRAKDAKALAHFYKHFKVESHSPNPSFSLKSDVPKEERIGKFARKYFHLTNYTILKGFSDNFTTYYLVKDLKTNTKYYLREEYFNGKVTLYYYTEKDIKKLIKEKKK
ncbi:MULTISPECIES: hypothetical protein [Capnocytophaga]|uniref:hypothetical protein n=1 Tax=Capnocytophaga TaxID=1016 RepID=UPI00020C5D32|nr:MULTISPECIES: hypothetical protein [unclassified Capnocytophaga]KHE70514.1 hypothetical protein HMPREF9074_07572 [Capnocytophaga sp. oral taxon 329 str. F0087]QGS17974.1 hypothetical protein FOC45_06730 [Capnocytophaga sp. FDAARGOS_737]